MIILKNREKKHFLNDRHYEIVFEDENKYT